MRKRTKIIISLSLICLTVPSVTSLKYIPTDYFRNIFFYADVYLYKDIIADGHINVITILTSEHDVSALKYYSKNFSSIASPYLCRLVSDIQLCDWSST